MNSWSNIVVEKDLAEELPPLHCDRNSISQVLINLLTNAADAMPEGGRIIIGTGMDQTTDRLLLTVSDTGPGIPEEIHIKIFDPFFTTKPVGKGTGLGLSMVRGIVEAHGGEIQVTSAQGRGAAFRISFPVGAPQVEHEVSSGRYGQ